VPRSFFAPRGYEKEWARRGNEGSNNQKDKRHEPTVKGMKEEISK
jgi:hypothetical protein